jgi:Sec-independent protein secretion pathway component TatC
MYVFDPRDGFQIIWVKLPVVWAIFLASPWVLYQVWAFIGPGLYRHERSLGGLYFGSWAARRLQAAPHGPSTDIGASADGA